MTDRFILQGHTPTPCRDLALWAEWYVKNDQVVKKHKVAGVCILTIFHGVDMAFRRLTDQSLPPMLFRTMIFGGELKGYQKPSASWDEAEQEHEKAVTLVCTPPDPPSAP